MPNNKHKPEVHRPIKLQSKRQRRKAYTQRNKNASFSSKSSSNKSSSNKSNSLNGVFRTVLTPKKRKANTWF